MAKMGRPKTIDASQNIIFRCPKATVKSLARIGKAWNLTRSEVIRKRVEDAESKL